jgi:hypothetical protein
MNLDSRQPAGDVRKETRQPMPFATPERVRDPMQPNSVHTGIAGENLENATRSRIFFKNCANILSNPPKHTQLGLNRTGYRQLAGALLAAPPTRRIGCLCLLLYRHKILIPFYSRKHLYITKSSSTLF